MNRSLDDYLLPKAQWQARRTEYLQRADLLEVADGQPTLLRLAERLERKRSSYGVSGDSAAFFPHT